MVGSHHRNLRLRSEVIEAYKARLVREWTEYRFEHREGGAFAVACSSPTGNQAHGNFHVGLAGQLGSEHYKVITVEQFDKALGGFLTQFAVSFEPSSE